MARDSLWFSSSQPHGRTDAQLKEIMRVVKLIVFDSKLKYLKLILSQYDVKANPIRDSEMKIADG